jgi:hypothetical protein
VKVAALLAGAVLLLTGCSVARTTTDQAHDAGVVADAIRGLDDAGSIFTMTQTLTAQGGDIPRGQMQSLDSQATGAVRGGVTAMTYKLKERQGPVAFEMIIARGQLFTRSAGTQAWRRAPVAGTSVFFPAVRLDLVREAVLLYRTVAASTLAVQNGVTRKYVIKPGATQMEQLQGATLDSSSEQFYLKHSTAEIDAFLGVRGGSLTRLEIHLTATDPSTQEVEKVDSLVDFKGGKVGPIAVPVDARPVQPSQILNP